MKSKPLLLLMCLLSSTIGVAEGYQFKTTITVLPLGKEAFKNTAGKIILKNADQLPSVNRDRVLNGAEALRKGFERTGITTILWDGDRISTETFEAGPLTNKPVRLLYNGDVTASSSGQFSTVSTLDNVYSALSPERILAITGIQVRTLGNAVRDEKSDGVHAIYTQDVQDIISRKVYADFPAGDKTHVSTISTYLVGGSDKQLINTYDVKRDKSGTPISVTYFTYVAGQKRTKTTFTLLAKVKDVPPPLKTFIDMDSMVTDYRLTPSAPYLKAKVSRKVAYRWNGVLPNDAKLRELELGMGQQSNDTTTLQFTGACLLLVGILYRFRPRRIVRQPTTIEQG